MGDEFSDIGSVKALLTDARDRIKESEERSAKKIDETEHRLKMTLDKLEQQADKFNLKIIEWLPLMTNMTKAEETRRSGMLMLVVALISNIAAWILVLFIWFIKSGAVTK
jgi:hypothetical protein